MTSPLRTTLCEGRLPDSCFGWTLGRGYVKKAALSKAQTHAAKAAALLRAVQLARGVESAADASELSALDLNMVRGKAPTVVIRSNLVVTSADGYPVLSLAHSGDLLLAAAGSAAATAKPAAGRLVLGIDVERMRTRDFARIGAHMSWRETASLRSAGGRHLTESLLFYRRWTLAESLYKALGRVNHECFAELELLALGEGWDSGWCSTVAAERNWFVRWWCVTSDRQPAMVCLLRGVQC